MRQTSGDRDRLRISLATSALGVALAAISLAILSGASVAAPTEIPANTGEPAISGMPLEGQTLTTTTGTWTGTQPMTFAYRWVRCGTNGGLPDGSNCSAISGATAKTYALRAADVGFRLRVRVTATNASGSAVVASNPTGTIAARKPRNVEPPTISGSAVEGSTLQASPGVWTGDPPITFSYRWLRCNTTGGSCGELKNATSSSYVVRPHDVGHTLRIRVTARNDAGSQTATSARTSIVQAKPGPVGVIVLPSGERSIPVTSVPNTERLIVSEVVFSPTPIRSRMDPISVRIRVKDTRGFVVRDALVFIRATPRVTSGGDRQTTATDGWVTYQLVPNSNFPQPRSGYNVQFFVKAYRAGDPSLAGVAAYRLVQVPTAGS
jgi:hypothetical protein